MAEPIAHTHATMDEPPDTSARSEGLNFFDLPREMRDKIYGFLLVDEGWIRMGTTSLRICQLCRADPSFDTSDCKHLFQLESRALSAQFLRTNRMIQAEASEVLYGRNRFDIAGHPWHLYPSPELALEKLGLVNTRHVRHIRIDLPTVIRHHDGRDLHLDEGAAEIVRVFKAKCNLKKITAYYSWINEFRRIGGGRREPVSEDVYLDIVEKFLAENCTNESKPSITILSSGIASDRMVEKWKQRGWKVGATERLHDDPIDIFETADPSTET